MGQRASKITIAGYPDHRTRIKREIERERSTTHPNE